MVGRPSAALLALLLAGCGALEPDPRVAYIERVDVPAVLSAATGGEVTVHYALSGCDQLYESRVGRTASSMILAVYVRPPRAGMLCTDGMVMEALTVAVAPPVTAPFQLTVRRLQGDTTFVIPVG